MLNVDSLTTGIVIDHIKSRKLYGIIQISGVGQAGFSVAIIKNAKSNQMGKKDIIKIDGMLDLDMDVLGFLDCNITVNIIDNGEIIEKKNLVLPETVRNVVSCKNPRCITSIEQGIDQVFQLSDPEKQIYRCIYCEQKYKPKN